MTNKTVEEEKGTKYVSDGTVIEKPPIRDTDDKQLPYLTEYEEFDYDSYLNYLEVKFKKNKKSGKCMGHYDFNPIHYNETTNLCWLKYDPISHKLYGYRRHLLFTETINGVPVNFSYTDGAFETKIKKKHIPKLLRLSKKQMPL